MSYVVLSLYGVFATWDAVNDERENNTKQQRGRENIRVVVKEHHGT